jgi:TPP-dependent pyruvate/acetoin dehydrogenase alpha subunit
VTSPGSPFHEEFYTSYHSGRRPTLLECLTYRWHGHMEGEDADYRDSAEIEARKQKCPFYLL